MGWLNASPSLGCCPPVDEWQDIFVSFIDTKSQKQLTCDLITIRGFDLFPSDVSGMFSPCETVLVWDGTKWHMRMFPSLSDWHYGGE